jgi:hypothetical protein
MPAARAAPSRVPRLAASTGPSAAPVPVTATNAVIPLPSTLLRVTIAGLLSAAFRLPRAHHAPAGMSESG